MKQIFSHQEIQAALYKLKFSIEDRYRGEKVLIVGIQDGCFMFLSDLISILDFKILDFEVDWVRVSSYDGTKSGEIVLKRDLEKEWKGRKIIFVDTIIDTGQTKNFITQHILNKGALESNISWCFLLSKMKKSLLERTYVCFEIELDSFPIGYGLDYKGQFRVLNNIYNYESH